MSNGNLILERERERSKGISKLKVNKNLLTTE